MNITLVMLDLEQRLLQDSTFLRENVEELVVELFLSEQIHGDSEFNRIKSSIQAINEGRIKPVSFYNYLTHILLPKSKNPISKYIFKNPAFFKDEELNEQELEFELKSPVSYPHTISGIKYIPNKVLHKVFNKIRELLEDRENLEDLISRYKEDNQDDMITSQFSNLKESQKPRRIIDDTLFNSFKATIGDTCEFTLYQLKLMYECNEDVVKLFSRISTPLGVYIKSQQVLEIQEDKTRKKSLLFKPKTIRKNLVEFLARSLISLEEEERDKITKRLESKIYSTNFSKIYNPFKGFEIVSLLFPHLDIEDYMILPNSDNKFSNSKKFELVGILNLVEREVSNAMINDITYKSSIRNALKTASSQIIGSESEQLLLPYYK